MRTWRVATQTMRCGFDPQHGIRKGESYLELEIGPLVKRVRCRGCAVARYQEHSPERVAEAPASDPIDSEPIE